MSKPDPHVATVFGFFFGGDQVHSLESLIVSNFFWGPIVSISSSRVKPMHAKAKGGLIRRPMNATKLKYKNKKLPIFVDHGLCRLSS